MKKKHLFLCMGLSALSLFTSCQSDEHNLDLAPADSAVQRDYLAVQICDIYNIIINDVQISDSCSGQPFNNVTADSTDTENGNTGIM